MKNQKGFNLVEGMLIGLVVAMIGFGGYYVWSQNNEDTPEQTEATQQETAESSVNQEDEPANLSVLTQDQYIIELPNGWIEEIGSRAPAGTPETYHQYTNNSGQTIGVSINSGGFGGGGSGSASFTIENDMFILDETFDACDPAIDEIGVCQYGNGELYLLVNSASEHNGDNYMFWMWDDNSEKQSAYANLKEIVETIKLL